MVSAVAHELQAHHQAAAACEQRGEVQKQVTSCAANTCRTRLGVPVTHELQAHHQAAAAHVADDVVLGLQLAQPGHQVRPHLQECRLLNQFKLA